MAICGTCGRLMDSAGEVCPHCSEYAAATSPVGTHSTSGSPEFASLPHFERPFAARQTVWPDVGIARSPAGRDDSGQRGLEQHGLEQHGLEQHGLEQHGLEQHSPDDPGSEEAADGSAPSDLPGVFPRTGRWIALTAANAVLLIAIAAAVTFVLQHEQASGTARIDRPSAMVRASSAARASALSAGRSQLTVSPAAATAPAESAIVTSLTRYFNAINSHDYLVYKRSFILALRGGISADSFSAEFGTTTDANEQLRSISVIGARRVGALVTFVSRQSSVLSPASLTCTAWSMEFSLGRRGSRYLLIAPPQWVQVSDNNCL